MLDWTIEMELSNGTVQSVPLSTDSVLYPLINAVPRRAPFLDDTEPTEVIYRRFELPLGEASAGSFGVERVSFIFDRSPRGAIIIDDLSVADTR